MNARENRKAKDFLQEEAELTDGRENEKRKMVNAKVREETQ
jgi:hypothetical protein